MVSRAFPSAESLNKGILDAISSSLCRRSDVDTMTRIVRRYQTSCRQGFLQAMNKSCSCKELATLPNESLAGHCPEHSSVTTIDSGLPRLPKLSENIWCDWETTSGGHRSSFLYALRYILQLGEVWILGFPISREICPCRIVAR